MILQRTIQHGVEQVTHRVKKNTMRKRKIRRTNTYRMLLKSQASAFQSEELNLDCQQNLTSTEINERIFHQLNSDGDHFDHINNRETFINNGKCTEVVDEKQSDTTTSNDLINLHSVLDDMKGSSSSDSSDDQSVERPKTRLHLYTNLSTIDCCEGLSIFLRQANVNKSHSSTLLKLVRSFLPVPNNMPESNEELLSLLNVEDLFTRRSLCLECNQSMNYQDEQCSFCQCVDQKRFVNIYDLDVHRVLVIVLERLSESIEEYKKLIKSGDDFEKTKDIPFCGLYQQLLKDNVGQNLISLLLHLDGIGLTKSTQLKLWLFSGSIVELPSRLRYRRYNMIPMSIWVGYQEPKVEQWLKSIAGDLNYWKTKGINTFTVRLSREYLVSLSSLTLFWTSLSSLYR